MDPERGELAHRTGQVLDEIYTLGYQRGLVAADNAADEADHLRGLVEDLMAALEAVVREFEPIRPDTGPADQAWRGARALLAHIEAELEVGVW